MDQKESKRETWGKWAEFFFSVLSNMVGLGNIWRFPYYCYKNGGGAFLVPFYIFLFLAAVPIFFIEQSYSQYSNLGPGKAWVMCPLFKGIGYGLVILNFLFSIYYSVIIAWILYYLFISLHPVLPWRYCNNEWNDWRCYETIPTTNHSGLYQMQNETLMDNLTMFNNSNSSLNSQAVSATEQFWKNHVLGMTSGVEDLGSIRQPLLLCLATVYITVFLCLIKGIKSSGKVVYVAGTLPYIVLTILLGRASTLPGAKKGLIYYLVPDWEKLKKFSVWKDAAVQIFFSTGVGCGGISTLSSFNDFHNNCQRDAILFPLIDGLTSLYAGLTVFSVLGYMSHISNTDISHVVTQGPGVAFVVFPEALSTLPFAQLWSTLFFLMLFIVGLGSQFLHIQTPLTALTDTFPSQLGDRRIKILLTAIISIISFLLGIVCVTEGGVYYVQIIDWYSASVSILFLALMEIIGICYIYDFSRFMDDVTMMIGYRPMVIWKPLCKYVAPICVLVCWIITLVAHTSLKYDSGEPFPIWVHYFGITIALMSVVPFVVTALIEILSAPGSFLERLKTSVTPTSEWGPAIKKYKKYNEMPLSTIENI